MNVMHAICSEKFYCCFSFVSRITCVWCFCLFQLYLNAWLVHCADRKIMAMPRTSMNTPDKHGQKNLGFFLQCNGETDSQLVLCTSYSQFKLMC